MVGVDGNDTGDGGSDTKVWHKHQCREKRSFTSAEEKEM